MNRCLIFCVIIAFCCCTASDRTHNMKLWYDKPAEQWVEALPLGNGRLGAMIYGNPVNEEIQLNEETIWAGSPYNNTNPLAKDALQTIQQLIFDEKYVEAQALCGEVISAPGRVYGMPYQTVGSLMLDFAEKENWQNYYRELDIQNAVATTTYTVDGVEYKRQYITSFSEQLVIIRLTASKKGKITFDAKFTSPYPDAAHGLHKEMLRLDATSTEHETIEGKLQFTALAKVVNEGGKQESKDNAISVTNANAVTIYVSVGTNFVDYSDISGNALTRAEQFMAAAGKNKFEQSLASHSAFYRNFFDRVTLCLGENEQTPKPTDVRVAEFQQKFDPQMAALYFQFGRYLLICSSQPGGQAANLQGIWNYHLRPPWDGKYTININTEMNYWPAELTALPEMHEPFIQLIRDVAETGKETAAMYGCRGWALHHNTDIWRSTGSVDGPRYGIWPTSNAWFCQHLWDRYLFSGARQYLQSVYPIMKSACEFFEDFLIREPKNNWWVVSPSSSPENIPAFARQMNVSVFAGCTMDNQMVFDLMMNTATAAEILGVDAQQAQVWKSIAAELPPMQVGQHSQLQEWMEDWDNPNDRHRHVSHLWGAYPGNQITLFETPELFDAVKHSLRQRGDASTSWSMGWKVCLWARLYDGNHAYKLLTDHFNWVTEERGQNGGTYPNLLSAHPPFQIDGNFGCATGIAEMLLQSHAGAVHILPALPDVWKSGTIKGLRCRGGFEVMELTWENNAVKKLTVKSNLGGNLRIRSKTPLAMNGASLQTANGANPNPFFAVHTMPEPIISPQAQLVIDPQINTPMYDMTTEAGKTYVFEMVVNL